MTCVFPTFIILPRRLVNPIAEVETPDADSERACCGSRVKRF